MPRKRKPKSLREYCLRSIALSCDDFWLRDFNLNFKDVPRLLYVIGPFESLTNVTIQDLLNSLAQEKCLRKQHISCLLQESITSLDLSSAAVVNGDLTIKTIIARCPRLKDLNLSGKNSTSAKSLSELVAAVTSLRKLNLRSTSCNDQVLSVLGHHNQSITDLDISCTPVTDSGAFSLLPRWDTEGQLGCRKLCRLNIQGTMIKFKGALHLLQNCTQLQYLGFEDVCAILEADMHQQLDKVVKEHPVILRYLTNDGRHLHTETKERISIACATCPNTVEASFNHGVTDQNATALHSLKQLQKLVLVNESELSFKGGVRPLLEAIGNQLTDLTLANVNDFDLVCIGRHCSNLKILFVDVTTIYDTDPVVSTPMTTADKHCMFRRLQDLCMLYPCPTPHFQASAFVAMLSNAKNIRILDLKRVLAFTSEMLQEILNNNPMTYLETLTLTGCHNVGPEILEVLVKGENNLKVLELLNCDKISLQDFQRFYKHAMKEHFNLSITWE